MRRKILSFWLSLAGALMNIGLRFLLGYIFLFIAHQGGSVSVYFFYIVGVSLVAIFGALIERKKSLIAGSIICLISGILLVIIAIISEREFSILFWGIPPLAKYQYLYVPSFLIIAGGVLGIWDFLQSKPSE